MEDNNSQLVYSTAIGRIKEEPKKTERPKGDGIVRISRQTTGRKGKGVCIITGLDLDDTQISELTSALKKKLGCGGVCKNGIIEIQGDKRELIKQFLEDKGFKVKLAGG
ncbi:stress response translation initiation inhibitor YciH [Thorsellia kenyensis]|uniref:Stress response translation initiation inhibitor YciH n=1 Tax=Thorsellia kenyensis TaxID=1549888 RepID=A0ABV6C8M3_9GAMM